MNDSKRRLLLKATFLVGLILSVVMVAWSQVAGDQLNLLGLGWRFAFEGDWPVHGTPTTGGGFTPGGLTAPVTGLPLMIWKDHRANAAATLLTHLLAYLLLDRVLRRVLGPEERLLFAVLYWLNPWRLYQSAYLWNANYLFLAGAIHLSTAWRMRKGRRFWPTFFHVLTLGLAVQLAVVALPLIVASPLLWWRRYIQPHIGAAIAATAVVGASLVPWALAASADSTLLPGSSGGEYFYLLNTTVRAAGYWVRYASLALSKEIFCLDFSRWTGDAAMAALAPLLEVVKKGIYGLTAALAIWANYRLWRDSSGQRLTPYSSDRSDREWLAGVVRWSFVAALITFAPSPFTVSRWYLLALFHVAVLPLVLLAGSVLRSTASPWPRRAAATYAAVSLLVCIALPLGAPAYRCGGERCAGAVRIPPLRGDHPMLDALGIQETCPVPVNVPGGWWMRALPEPGSVPADAAEAL